MIILGSADTYLAFSLLRRCARFWENRDVWGPSVRVIHSIILNCPELSGLLMKKTSLCYYSQWPSKLLTFRFIWEELKI